MPAPAGDEEYLEGDDTDDDFYDRTHGTFLLRLLFGVVLTRDEGQDVSSKPEKADNFCAQDLGPCQTVQQTDCA